MYYFIEPFTKQLDEELSKRFKKHSSDLSSEPEGYVVDEAFLNSLTVGKSRSQKTFKIYGIPERYQMNIEEFITDFWDGNYSFKYGYIKE